MIAGGGGTNGRRAFPSSASRIASSYRPLKFAQDACGLSGTGPVHGGMPVLLLSAGTGRAPPRRRAAGGRRIAPGSRGNVSRGLVYVKLDQAGASGDLRHLVAFVSDLRTGAMSGGSPEQALLSAASAQLAQFYNLTGGTASGHEPNAKGCRERAKSRAMRRLITTRWSVNAGGQT